MKTLPLLHVDNNVSIKALRFLSHFSELTVIFSGMRTIQKIDANIKVFDAAQTEINSLAKFKLNTVDELCYELASQNSERFFVAVAKKF